MTHLRRRMIDFNAILQVRAVAIGIEPTAAAPLNSADFRRVESRVRRRTERESRHPNETVSELVAVAQVYSSDEPTLTCSGGGDTFALCAARLAKNSTASTSACALRTISLPLSVEREQERPLRYDLLCAHSWLEKSLDLVRWFQLASKRDLFRVYV